ncbi:hypothetical protein SBC2_78130 (plasmid) [Caballeronia sp. SBC2]|nr:hypothetical protein SBC2_78130 [Caballeronia sp. SBC2]
MLNMPAPISICMARLLLIVGFYRLTMARAASSPGIVH